MEIFPFQEKLNSDTLFQMTNDELYRLRENGFIAAEHENEEEFKKRIAFCESLTTSFTSDPTLSQRLEEGIAHLHPLYAIAPRWIPLYYSNKGLPPWQAGCAWIFQTEKGGPTGATIQLRKKFYRSSTYFSLSIRELIAHELAHVGRLAFNEPKYEEFFAYETAETSFRKRYGPLFQSAYESLFLLLLFFIPLLFSLYAIFTYTTLEPLHMLSLQLLPLAYILFLLVRLYRRRSNFTTTKKKLQSLYGEKAGPIFYMLTDTEIELFPKLEEKEIDEYLRDSSSLRKQQIAAYLNKL